MNRVHSLRLGLVEVISQNYVHQARLRDFKSIGLSLDKLLIIVRDDELFVFFRECPTTHLANQLTSSAGVALDVVALLAERLPVAKIIRAIPGSRNFVVWAELYIGLLSPARGTSIPVLFLDLFPFSPARLGPRLFLLAYVQTLQLVPITFFPDRSESFVALQFPQTAERVEIRATSCLGSVGINCRANVFFGKDRAWNTVPCGPKRIQNDRVIDFVCGARIHKTSRSVGKPLLSASFGFVRYGPRCEKQAFTGTRFSHLGARL